MAILAYSEDLQLSYSLFCEYYIYVLRNPIKNNEVFYVGITSQKPSTRLSGHLSDGKNPNGANKGKCDYIKSILDNDSSPVIQVIETIDCKCYIDKTFAFERELFWIKYHKDLGCSLTNISGIDSKGTHSEYQGYLSCIKRGESQWRYYLCGRTVHGQDVYYKERVKKDGFAFPEPEVRYKKEDNYHPYENSTFYSKIKPNDNNAVITEMFPAQPSWSAEFLKDLPPALTIFEDIQADDCDYECDELELDMSDYELDSDTEMDFEDGCKDFYEPIRWEGYKLSDLILPFGYYVKTQI